MKRLKDGSAFEAMASYSRAARGGDFVAVSGTAALDEHGVALYPGDAGAQTREAFERAIEAAAALGARREDIIRTRIFLAPGADWRGPVEAHGECFKGVDPANTTMHIGEFIPEGCLVEVEVEAVASEPAAG